MGSGLPPEDHSGKTYGHWTAIRRAPPQIPSTPGVAVPWLCVCDNGHERWLLPAVFKYEAKRVRCSDCFEESRRPIREMRKERKRIAAQVGAERVARRERIANGDEISPHRWRGIQACAVDRGIPLMIGPDYVLSIFKQQNGRCALSGIQIYLPASMKDLGTASLDRIDSSEGYIEGNVQWVHKAINKMKMDFPEHQFIELCALVGSWSARG